MLVPTAVTKQTSINSAVAEVVQILSNDVIRIRYDFAPDWSGDPAIYFRIVLSDQVSPNRLNEVTKRVEQLLEERLDFRAMGVFSYYNYRNQSEHAALPDLSWE